MKKSGSGVPKLTNTKILNGSGGRNKGTGMKAGTNKANGTSAKGVTKVK